MSNVKFTKTSKHKLLMLEMQASVSCWCLKCKQTGYVKSVKCPRLATQIPKARSRPPCDVYLKTTHKSMTSLMIWIPQGRIATFLVTQIPNQKCYLALRQRLPELEIHLLNKKRRKGEIKPAAQGVAISHILHLCPFASPCDEYYTH